MNTTENNKKIAEFMGHRYDDNRNSHSSSDFYYEDSELEYNSSWDWLMEVVEKIENLNYRVSITEFATNISDETLKISQWQPKTKILRTYEAIISFIDWYNKNGAKEN